MKTEKFIGRESELSKLNKLLDKKSASLVVIRGRRRVGKSRLAKEFAKGKSFYRFSGIPPEKEMSAQDQRDYFAEQLIQNHGIAKPDSSSWANLFHALSQAVSEKPSVILFDEISWMAHDAPTFLPKLKDFWDKTFSQKSQVILILCGSISSWIEKNILSSTGYFGRISTLISLKPLSISESVDLLKSNGFKGSNLEAFLALSVTGGIPWYLELLQTNQPIAQSIHDLCFEADAILYREYDRIFNDLFGRRSKVYSDIVQLLIDGRCEYKTISKKINYPSGGPLSEYLDDLAISGIVSKEQSWSLKTGLDRQVIQYRLQDNFLRFYLKYVLPNQRNIENGLFEERNLTSLKGFNTMLGLQLENLVLANQQLIYKALNLKATDIVASGPFLQRKTKKLKGCQIDFLIQTKFKTLYVCEIKYTQRQLGVSVIDEVSEKISSLSKPNGYACIPVLIHFGELSEKLEDSDFFVQLINFEEFLNN